MTLLHDGNGSKKYRLSKEDYHKILQDQNGACYLCLRTLEQIRRQQQPPQLTIVMRPGSTRPPLLQLQPQDPPGHSGKAPPLLADCIKIYLTRKVDYGKVPE